MSKLNLILLCIVFSCVSQALLIGSIMADNANFKVEPQTEHVITLSLKETDGVSGSFSVISDDETGINFFIASPLNQTILRYLDVGQKSFSFTAQATGDYEFHFDNSVSSTSAKTVALNYNVTHYTMGMPQEQFLLLVVFAFALIGIIIYAVLVPK